MVPVDLSDRNERALGAALVLAREHGGRVTLFHVIQCVSGIAPGEFDAFYRRLVERSERKLRQIARKFAEGGFDVRTAVRVGEPAATWSSWGRTRSGRVAGSAVGAPRATRWGSSAGARSYLSSEDTCHTPAIAPGASWQTDAMVLVSRTPPEERGAIDPIVRVRPRAVPSLAIKGPGVFMSRPVHRVQELPAL
jgi:hypothetical protein